ncbi:MAG: YdeI/OmpD-associated family protein [Acidimicrobiaceae bacterium]|nr:YdeI/OmpD-associated family protein [Acidimicrobiaceae bacterium]
MGTLSFRTELVSRGPAAGILLDDDQVAVLGEGAKRFPVRATVNGYSWRTSVARMGGESLVGLNREVRAGAGVEAGDSVEVTLELDTEPREVEVPADLAAALAADAEAGARFDAMAFTHRKEYARWVADAKRADTRERRVHQALEMIRDGRTRT